MISPSVSPLILNKHKKEVCLGSGPCPSLDFSLAFVGLAHMQVSTAGRAQDCSIKICDCKGPSKFLQSYKNKCLHYCI